MIEFFKNGSLCEGEKIPELDEKKILDIIIKIALAMNYLHSQGIIHRDLKLANILLDESFNPKLSDFGLLMKDSEKTDEVVTVGTGPYIAPEIWKNNNYSKASDVYAVGILVYELVTKKFAFKGQNDNVIMYTISFAKKRPQLNGQVSSFYKNLISSCWDNDPEKRPTFSEIIEDLMQFQHE